jgi:spectinomycin phosphotransferase/16S rRNA (guanine(1405)-N(7))-methyltransferase
MLEPPADLGLDELTATLARWGLAPVDLEYAPLGFGSHHWIATDAAGERMFVTVDEGRPVTPDEPDPFAALRTAMSTARALADRGLEFVVAPLPSSGGSVVEATGGGYAATVFPFVTGGRFGWEDRLSPVLEAELISHLARLHREASGDGVAPRMDGFDVPDREVLDSILLEGRYPDETGPYTRRMAGLIIDSAPPLLSVLDRYDRKVAAALSTEVRAVITHGEPHQGNTIDTPSGLRLVDWDTTLLAPPARDLWRLGGPGDDLIRAYEELTGSRVDPAWLGVYRARWDLADLAVYASQFARAHPGDANDDASWGWMQSLVDRLVVDADLDPTGETPGAAL